MTATPAPRDDGVVDVLIVGAGPAGLSAATELKRLGLGSVVVVEREREAGGVPRHCGHPPFGMREFSRVLTGPAYARRLAARALEAGVTLKLGATVVGIERGESLVATLTDDGGLFRIKARRIVLATGVRERTRAQRLASGDRPIGVLNTGALQAYAYLQHLAPFRRPVIVGTELVALSSLLTCRAVGAKPVAMIEENAGPTVRRAFMALPRLLGVPVRYGAHIVDIRGKPRVERVSIRTADGSVEDIACDGVLFTGRFIPESSLARRIGLVVDPGTRGPSIDQFGRTSDPRVFAAGNLLRPVETAGWSWDEGRRVAGFVADDLKGRLPSADGATAIEPGRGVRYIVPQRLAPGGGGLDRLQLRVSAAAKGRLVARRNGAALASMALSAQPERRVLFPAAGLAAGPGPVVVGVEPLRE